MLVSILEIVFVLESKQITKLVKSMKRNGKNIEGGRCLENWASLTLIEEEFGKDTSEKIMNELNVWDYVTTMLI